MRYCENCKAEIDSCDKFCIECGAMRQEQMESNKNNFCEECKAEIDLCDKFCIECGAIRQEQIESNINNFCEECGTKSEKGDSFCTECGNAIDGCIVKEDTKSPATWQSEANNRFVISSDNQEAVTAFNLQKAKTRKSKSKTVIALVVIVAVLVVSSGVLTYFYFDRRNTGSNTYPLESDTKFKSESTTEETTTEPSKPVVNPSDYLGYWHIDASTDKELTIHKIDGHKAEFSLWYYRLASIENVIVTIDGNTAEFSVNDYGGIKGIITFNVYSVTINITESELRYIPVEIMTFNSRHSVSWENYGFETSETDVHAESLDKTGEVLLSDHDSYLNVRIGPGKDYPILKDKKGGKVHLYSGNIVSILSEHRGTDNDNKKWYKITFEFGGNILVGYVHSDYIFVYGGAVENDNSEYLNKEHHDIKNIDVNDISFTYVSSYSDENISYKFNLLEIELVKSGSYPYTRDEYEIKVDGEVMDRLNRDKYLVYFEYDKDYYLIGKYLVSNSRIDGMFRERHLIQKINEDTVYIFIDIAS
ncbi:MAG TPA: zinc ribbon domain-containing protein [Oscillospiraceae bacterium]|nr:zinc ribbon domain-containing protein [Oscillospiraceae bacterium]